MKSKITNEEIMLTKVSSKGQIVIPNEFRKRFDIQEGNILAVTSGLGNIIVLKKLNGFFSEDDFQTVKKIKDS